MPKSVDPDQTATAGSLHLYLNSALFAAGDFSRRTFSDHYIGALRINHDHYIRKC